MTHELHSVYYVIYDFFYWFLERQSLEYKVTLSVIIYPLTIKFLPVSKKYRGG